MRCDVASRVAHIFFIMCIKWQLAKASESLRCGGKELSAENINSLPHRIRTRSPRFGRSEMTENCLAIVFHCGPALKLPDICLKDEEKPRKNLTQETCPDRGSNPGTLRDRRTCYRLAHSGGLNTFLYFSIYAYVYKSSSQEKA